MEPQEIQRILIHYLVLLFSLSVHESAHAWAALQQGDDTALREGRISLNPLVHIDPIGTVLFPLMGLFMGGWIFGWAKPTPMQPRNFRDFRWGQISTAGAGPVSNFLLAIMFTVLYGFATRVASLDNPLVLICWTGIWLNVLLGVFNLLPVPPLDGSWIASWGLPRKWGDLYDKYMEPYGFLILIGLFITGALGFIVGVIVWPVAFFLRDLVA
ncbi:MAG: site-2 protease family protein [Vicinamibacteria bacterium]